MALKDSNSFSTDSKKGCRILRYEQSKGISAEG